MHSSLQAVRYSIRGALLLVSIHLAVASTPAQSTPPKNTPVTPAASPAPSPTLERRFFKNILRDQRAIWTSPLRINGKDAKWLAPLALSTAALIATDRHTAGALTDHRDRINASRIVSYAGALYTTGSVAAVFYIVGRGRGNLRARETGLLGAQALINGQIVSQALKISTQRPRPLEGDGRGRFFDGGRAFPSGHAVSAWSLATVVAQEYRHKKFVRFTAYGLAAAVSASRFTGRKHFISDVLVGSAIGYGIGRYVYDTHHDPSIDSDEGVTAAGAINSRLFPVIAPHYNRRGHIHGARLTWNF